jgi:hypothetical protein
MQRRIWREKRLPAAALVSRMVTLVPLLHKPTRRKPQASRNGMSVCVLQQSAGWTAAMGCLPVVQQSSVDLSDGIRGATRRLAVFCSQLKTAPGSHASRQASSRIYEAHGSLPQAIARQSRGPQQAQRRSQPAPSQDADKVRVSRTPEWAAGSWASANWRALRIRAPPHPQAERSQGRRNSPGCRQLR